MSPNNRREQNPKAILLSKRANVFYLEHARVAQKDERVVFLTHGGAEVERYFNIPERNTAFLLLGKGTSITDAAVRRLAEANVVVGFCGSGGSPLFGAVDIAFLTPQSEYRPTEYMQAWLKIWADGSARLQLGKKLLLERSKITLRFWSKDPSLLSQGISLSEALIESFANDVERAASTAQLLAAEGAWAKKLYALLARGFGFDFSRREGAGREDTLADRANSFLDHGNYLAYGFAATALYGLGISYSLPILHGKTRRGALVFDVADLIKDAHVMPTAFLAAKRMDSADDFRSTMIERFQANEVLDYLFTFLSDACQKSS